MVISAALMPYRIEVGLGQLAPVLLDAPCFSWVVKDPPGFGLEIYQTFVDWNIVDPGVQQRVPILGIGRVLVNESKHPSQVAGFKHA